MDDDSFEDSLEGEMDEPFTGDTELDDEPIDAEKQDDLTLDLFILGGAMGFAFGEGVEERRRKRLLKEQSKRRKRKRFSDDSD
jgi:hypothetical protein